MFLISYKAGIKNMRSYQNKKRSRAEIEANNTLELPLLPPSRPKDIWTTSIKLRLLANRDLSIQLDSTKLVFKSTIKEADIKLQKAYLLQVKHSTLQIKIREQYLAKNKSQKRRSIYKGGPRVTVTELRGSIDTYNTKERTANLVRA